MAGCRDPPFTLLAGGAKKMAVGAPCIIFLLGVPESSPGYKVSKADKAIKED
jgi:hypothetical protein